MYDDLRTASSIRRDAWLSLIDFGLWASVVDVSRIEAVDKPLWSVGGSIRAKQQGKLAPHVGLDAWQRTDSSLGVLLEHPGVEWQT
jgi:hypothetical protein